jgi:hypothetical protein
VCDISVGLAVFLQSDPAGARALLQRIVFQFAQYGGFEDILHLSQVKNYLSHLVTEKPVFWLDLQESDP